MWHEWGIGIAVTEMARVNCYVVRACPDVFKSTVFSLFLERVNFKHLHTSSRGGAVG
jgi:hypothetical protein